MNMNFFRNKSIVITSSMKSVKSADLLLLISLENIFITNTHA